MTRTVRLYEEATSASQRIRTLDVDEIVTATDSPMTNDYVEVTTDLGERGWVYRYRVSVITHTGTGGGGGGGASGPRPIHGTTTLAFTELLPLAGDQMRVHFIDVGQGASTLLEFPCGAALIDTGGEDVPNSYHSVPALRGYLDAFFASRSDLSASFDLFALTHPHIDHTRGVAEVMNNYGLSNVIDNGQRRNDLGGNPQIALQNWLNLNSDITAYDGILESEIAVGGLTSAVIDPFAPCTGSTIDPRIRVLWGQLATGDSGAGNPNNNSLVIRVDFGAFSMLVTGDLEVEGINGLLAKYSGSPDILDVDVYEVGHHGSRNATTPALVSALSPELAVFCCGPFERTAGVFIARQFGHPNRVSVTALEAGITSQRTPVQRQIGVKGAFGSNPSEFEQQTISDALFATGWEGNIVLTANANGSIEVWTELSGTNAGFTPGR